MINAIALFILTSPIINCVTQQETTSVTGATINGHVVNVSAMEGKFY